MKRFGIALLKILGTIILFPLFVLLALCMSFFYLVDVIESFWEIDSEYDY